MSERKRRIDDVGNSDNDSRKKQARNSNLGSGANSGPSSSVLNAEAVAKAPKTAAAIPSQTVSGEALGTKSAPAEAEQSRDKGKQRQEQVQEATEAAKEAAGGIPVNNQESTAGPSTAPSKQPPVKRHRRKKSEPVPDPVETTLARLKNNPRRRVDVACDNCRNNKLKCDNTFDGCAECVKRNIRCSTTLATGETHYRGITRVIERLNGEVERLRAENMQLRRVLAQRAVPNYNGFWNPPPAKQASNPPPVEQAPPPPPPGQAPPYTQYGAYPQGQAVGQGSGHFQAPQNAPQAVRQGADRFSVRQNAPLTWQGGSSMPLAVSPLGQGTGYPAVLENRPLTGPGPFYFPRAANVPAPEQGSAYQAALAPSSSSSSGSSPYRQTPSEASENNDDTDFRAANNDPAFANQVALPMTEQGGGQPAPTGRRSLPVTMTGLAPPMTEQGGGQPAPTGRRSPDVAMTGLGDNSFDSFEAEPANPDDVKRLYIPTEDNGYNGNNGYNGGNGYNGYNDDNGDNGNDAFLQYDAAIAADRATEPSTIDPASLNLEPVNYPQVDPAPTLTLWELQNGRNDGPQQN